MKLRLSLFRMTWTFLIAAVIGAGIIFLMMWDLFINSGWDWRQWTVISAFIVSTIFFYVLTIFQNYYILEKKYVLVHRFKREMFYYFSDVIYIDEKYSKKHKMILFVTNRGDIRYLTFDRKGILYETMLDKCTNLIDKESVKIRFPNIKL